MSRTDTVFADAPTPEQRAFTVRYAATEDRVQPRLLRHAAVLADLRQVRVPAQPRLLGRCAKPASRGIGQLVPEDEKEYLRGCIKAAKTTRSIGGDRTAPGSRRARIICKRAAMRDAKPAAARFATRRADPGIADQAAVMRHCTGTALVFPSPLEGEGNRVRCRAPRRLMRSKDMERTVRAALA